MRWGVRRWWSGNGLRWQTVAQCLLDGFRQRVGELDVELNQEIAALRLVLREWQTLAWHTLHGARIHLIALDLERFAFQILHDHRGTAQCFLERDFRRVHDVLAFSLEDRMWLVFDDEEHVGRNGVRLAIALLLESYPSLRFPARLDVDLHDFLFAPRLTGRWIVDIAI